MKRVFIAIGCAVLLMSAAVAVSGRRSRFWTAQQPQGGLIPITLGAIGAGKAIEMDSGPLGVSHGANLYPVAATSAVAIDSVNFPEDFLYTSLGLPTLNQTPPDDFITNADPVSNTTVIDWVKDTLPNTDSASVFSDLASGIIPNSLSENPLTGFNAQSGIVDPTNPGNGPRGHWFGQRIVDGIGGDDRDVFIKGGKENSPLHLGYWTGISRISEVRHHTGICSEFYLSY